MSNLIPERLLSARIIDKDHPIIDTMIIKADNVLDYLYGEDRKGNDFDRSQLTNVAPPFENMFVQFLWEGNETGILIQSQRLKDHEAEWLLRASIWFMPSAQRNMDEPVINWVITLNAEGRLMEIDGQASEQWSTAPFKDEPEYMTITLFMGYLVTAALFAINLMNCKNVIAEEQPVSRQELRREQKHNKPAFRYHLLKVRSANKTYALGDGKGSRDQYSTHIVRGHFKTYTDAAPLMGRFVGTYWWDAHVAGRDKSHVVDKDYVVESTQ